jgi:hypothetical protein
VPAISAETLALYSLAFGCDSADRGLKSLPAELSAAHHLDFLQEHILFHHFMAIVVSSIVLHDSEACHAYCGRMVDAIGSASRLLPSGELGLRPLKHFSNKDREDAIRICLLNPPNIFALLGQELYIERNPSESELRVMNELTALGMTGWDSPSATVPLYFGAALLARLAGALHTDVQEHIGRDFIDLFIYVVSETRSAYPLYMDLLGAKVMTESDYERERKANEDKGSWLSNLFKRTIHRSAARDKAPESPASLPLREPEWVNELSQKQRPEPAQAPFPPKLKVVSDDVPTDMIEKGLYFRRNVFSSISNWEDRMVSEFGEKVVPFLGRIWNRTS